MQSQGSLNMDSRGRARLDTPGAVADFEDGERVPEAEECRKSREAGKGKEADSPPEPPERNTALLTPWFQPSETGVRFLTYRTVR